MPNNEHISSAGLAINYKEEDLKEIDEYLMSVSQLKDDLTRVAKPYMDKKDDLRRQLEEVNNEKDKIEESYLKRHKNYGELQEMRKNYDKAKDNYDLKLETSIKMLKSIRDLENNMLDSFPNKKYEIDPLLDKRFSILKEMRNINQQVKEAMKKLLPDSDAPKPFLYFEGSGDDRTLAGSSMFSLTFYGGNLNMDFFKIYDRICFESEINSNDEAISELYYQHEELFENDFFKPVSYSSAIDYLSYKRYTPDDYNCGSYLIAKTIFPDMPFNADQFYNFMTKLAPRENFLNALADKSCSLKRQSKKPEFEIRSKNPFYHLNQDLDIGRINLGIIDAELEKGKIVGVGYDPRFLVQKNPSQPKKNHPYIYNSWKYGCLWNAILHTEKQLGGKILFHTNAGL